MSSILEVSFSELAFYMEAEWEQKIEVGVEMPVSPKETKLSTEMDKKMDLVTKGILKKPLSISLTQPLQMIKSISWVDEVDKRWIEGIAKKWEEPSKNPA